MSDAVYLADSNVLIHLVAARYPALRKRVEHQGQGQVVTSAICVAEVMFGAEARGEAIDLTKLLGRIEPLPFDAAAGRAFARVPFRRGRMDRLIAAHALSLGLTVVTDNEADFAGVTGLAVENWTR